jgi:putative FmdB family regulatory protein
MPIYEYACDMCGAHFEQRQSFGDASAPSCPNGHAAVHRVYSVPGVVFKGSGFYVTDSRAKSSSTSDD